MWSDTFLASFSVLKSLKWKNSFVYTFDLGGFVVHVIILRGKVVVVLYFVLKMFWPTKIDWYPIFSKEWKRYEIVDN
jgi:hypothetical protein